MTDAAHRTQKHDWVAAPAGQGRGYVCNLCGQRQEHVDAHGACTGIDDPVVPTAWDYNPYSEEK